MASNHEDAALSPFAVTSEGDMLFGSSDPPLADQRSVMVAETGLKWQDDGEPRAAPSQLLCTKSPALLLVLVLSLYSCALRGQTTEASVTGHNGCIVFHAVRLRTWKK